MGWTIGIDIGGTFTDCVCSTDGITQAAKAPTVKSDPGQGVLDALDVAVERLATTRGELLADTEVFVHGCTIGTNAVIERSGAVVALLVTAGHEDVLRIGRLSQKVAGLSVGEITHTSRLQRPRPLVDHSLTFGVAERIDRSGKVVVELDEDGLREVAASLRDAGVSSIAVCYLWSFVNPAHEERTREILAEELPDAEVALSADISPTLGEYERCVATVLNAYVNPRMRAYLEPLERELQGSGLGKGLQVFDAGGGVTSVRGALEMGVRTIDSGPVGGVVAAQALGKHLERPNLICADMGGTSLDVAVVWNGTVEEETQPTIDQYAYSVPRVAVKSIGAGGGSIAWVDASGHLRVGPHSAGSVPGPVCYGKGGTAPTVTDANVILGALNREALLGGEMPIDHDGAVRAFESLAEQLGEDVWTVAGAVIGVVNAQMADLVRRTTLERGFDPRDFTLVVYGGAGPAHGVAIGREVGCGSVLFPDLASVFAAQGMAACDMLGTSEAFLNLSSPFERSVGEEVRRTVAQLRERIDRSLRSDGQDLRAVEYRAQVGMKYQGQVAELPVDASWALNGGTGDLDEDFTRLYRRIYGQGAVVDGARVDLTRVRLEGRIARAGFVGAAADGDGGGGLGEAGTRQVLFPGEATPVETPIIAARGSLAGHSGTRLAGPVIVERYGETIVIPSGSGGEVMDDGSVLVTLEEGS